MDNHNVRNLLLQRLQFGVAELHDICCLGVAGRESLHFIHFDLECAPGYYCYLDPGFLVAVDMRNESVRIIDDAFSPADIPFRTMFCLLEGANRR